MHVFSSWVKPLSSLYNEIFALWCNLCVHNFPFVVLDTEVLDTGANIPRFSEHVYFVITGISAYDNVWPILKPWTVETKGLFISGPLWSLYSWISTVKFFVYSAYIKDHLFPNPMPSKIKMLQLKWAPIFLCLNMPTAIIFFYSVIAEWNSEWDPPEKKVYIMM